MAVHSLPFRLVGWGRLKRGQWLQLQADGGTVDFSLVIVVCGFFGRALYLDPQLSF